MTAESPEAARLDVLFPLTAPGYGVATQARPTHPRNMHDSKACRVQVVSHRHSQT